MNASQRLHGAALALLVGSTLALAGCSSDTPPADDTSTPVVTPATTPNVTPDVTPEETPDNTGTTIEVIETEFSITLSEDTLAPGTYTFEIANDGGSAHDLAISGPGVDNQVTSTIGPGGNATLTVTLEAGTYELWCTINGHRASGMDTTVTVS